MAKAELNNNPFFDELEKQRKATKAPVLCAEAAIIMTRARSVISELMSEVTGGTPVQNWAEVNNVLCDMQKYIAKQKMDKIDANN